MRRMFWAAGVAAMVGACGGGESAAPAASEGSGAEASSGAESAATPREACLAVMRRERTCQDTFLPALVGLRVRLDQPAGIAAADAASGREALVSEARTEYAADSTDERFEANCAQMDGLPPEQAEQWAGMMRACLAAATCDAFVECDMGFVEARIGGGS